MSCYYKCSLSIHLPSCSNLNTYRFLLYNNCNSCNRALSYEQRIRFMESALLNNEPVSFLPFFKQSVVYGLHNRIMQALDDGEHLKE